MARGPARPRARRPPLSAMDARNCSLRLCGREYRDYRPAGWRHASILRKGLERAPFLGGACVPRPLSPSRASADLVSVGGGRELKRPLDAPPPCRRRCTAVLCFAHATGSAHRPRTQMPRGRCRLRSCTGAGLSGSGEGAHALRERETEREGGHGRVSVVAPSPGVL